MQNLFSFIMTILFRNHWHMFALKYELAKRLFLDEVEMNMQKDKVKERRELVSGMQKQLDDMEEVVNQTDEEIFQGLIDSATDEEERESISSLEGNEKARAISAERKRLAKENAEDIAARKVELKARTEELEKEDDILKKAYGITYQNRLRYDYLTSYKPRKGYAEKK